jgi:hypothetical protein
MEVGKRNLLGKPFSHLKKSSDPRDQATRDELAPAVNLFDVLKQYLSEDQAFSVARQVILGSSLLHLRSTYPDFGKSDFRHLVEGGSSEASSRLATDFAFADTKVLEITKDKASFDVVDCRIPRTLALVGAERLASIFCEVDLVYFRIYEPGVRLVRSHTIWEGADICDFRLTWRG